MKKIKFAYLSSENPNNKKVWSGTHYSILKSLQQIGDVTILGPYEPKIRVFISKVINQLFLKILNKRVSYRHSIFISKGYAQYFNKLLKNNSYDFIIAPAASCEIAFVNTNIPIIYITDGTFNSCLGYHKSLSNLTQKSIREGNLIEQLAINNSNKVIVSSKWAEKSVIDTYKKNEDLVKIIPYGANFEIIPNNTELKFEAPIIWKLFFVGVYWESKGGDIAYNAFKLLIEKGYNVEFTVLGCIPPNNITHPKMKIIPFIDKNSSDGQHQMKEIYKEQHLLILPTRFDCTPIVINEASAFGIPSLIANSGGVEGHLKENINGYLIPYENKGDKYADKIEELINNPTKYNELRKSTRKLYENKLNWQHWSSALKELLDN